MSYEIDYKKFFERTRHLYYQYLNDKHSEKDFIENYRREMASLAQSSEGPYVIQREKLLCVLSEEEEAEDER